MVKFQVVFNDGETWMNMKCYGDKILSFGGPDGKLIGSYSVETIPPDHHRPSRVYEFYNALYNSPLSRCNVHVHIDIVFEDKTPRDRHLLIEGHESVELPADLENGCWLLHPGSEGFDENRSYFLKYKNYWSSVDRNKLFLNPSNSLADGQVSFT